MNWGLFWSSANLGIACLNAAYGHAWLALIGGTVGGLTLATVYLDRALKGSAK